MTESDRSSPQFLNPLRSEQAPPYAPSFRLISTPVSGHCLLMSGDLDLAGQDRLRRALASLPLSSDGKPLVLDLTQVTYMDCASLKVLLQVSRSASASRPVIFRFSRGQPRRMVSLLGLEDTLGLDSISDDLAPV